MTAAVPVKTAHRVLVIASVQSYCQFIGLRIAEQWSHVSCFIIFGLRRKPGASLIDLGRIMPGV